MSDYSDALSLFGDPFSRPQAYSQPSYRNSYSQNTLPSTKVTQQKTPVQQPEKSNSTETQAQQSQPTTNFATQAQTPVPQQKSNAPAPKPVKSVPVKEPAPEDTKPTPPKKALELDMSSGSATNSKVSEDDTAKRKAHEEAEAKRKAEWEAKQLAKKQAEEAALQKLNDMSDDDVIAASIKRVSTDVERLTRRNMKECVSAHIQELARKDPAFARRTMHPRKSMVNCFKYINRMAKEFIQQEMKDNDIKPENGVYGGDVPDDVVYQWAVDYFNATDAPEDQVKEEKFTPKPYVGTTKKTPPKTKKAESKAKQAEKQATKENTKNQEPSNDYQQMSLF